MNSIIVIGVNHHNTLGMVRSLGLTGIKCNLICIGEGKSFIPKSRYVKFTIFVQSGSDVVDALLNNFADDNERPIVISCTDGAESVLDLNYDSLKDRFIFFNSQKQGLVTKYMNKQIQVEMAEDVGFNVPKSINYNGSIENVAYPCLLKPVESFNGGKKVEVCVDETELRCKLDVFPKGEGVQIQQFIKKEHEIVVLGVSVNGEVIIPGYILKHREHNGGTTYSSVYPYNELDGKLVSGCMELIKNMNYDGLFGIEFICSEGMYYYIETNLRNDATSYAMTVAGVNLPYIYCLAKLGMPYAAEANKKVKHIDSIVEFNDFKHRKENGVSLLNWLKQCLESKCKYYWSIKDIRPFLTAPFTK